MAWKFVFKFYILEKIQPKNCSSKNVNSELIIIRITEKLYFKRCYMYFEFNDFIVKRYSQANYNFFCIFVFNGRKMFI